MRPVTRQRALAPDTTRPSHDRAIRRLRYDAKIPRTRGTTTTSWFPKRQALLGTDRSTVVHRFHWTAQSDILDAFQDFPGPFEFSFKYSVAQMYSIPNPPFIQPLLENHAPGRKTWLTVRNDDIYTFRFGDPAYARQYILNMRSADKLAGFYMGPDGYIWGRDFLERHPDPGPRPLVMEKQWYWAYDCFEQPRLQHAATNWTLFVTKMGDFEKNADPSQSN